jgi:hypothetical protein
MVIYGATKKAVSVERSEESKGADWSVPFPGKTARGFGYESRVLEMSKME